MNSSQLEKQPPKITSVIVHILGHIVSWLLGSIFALFGIVSLFSEPLPGIILLIMATVLLPPLSKQVEQRLKTTITTGHKVPLILIGLMLFAFTLEKKDSKPSNSSVQQLPQTIVAEQTQQPAISPITTTATVVRDEPTLTPTTTPIPSPPVKSTNTLGRSYDQIKSGFDDILSFESSPLAGGQPRYLGKAPESSALLEIIGDKKDIEEASLIMFFASDDATTSIKNTVYVLRFVQNIFPNWTDADEWLKASLKEILNDYTTKSSGEVEKVYGNIRMTLSGIKDLGMITLRVQHK